MSKNQDVAAVSLASQIFAKIKPRTFTAKRIGIREKADIRCKHVLQVEDFLAALDGR